ncbi:MAG: LegC family aminotransferase [Oscillospiraceae bacterium]
MSDFIPLSVPNLRGNEKKYMDEAIEAEWVSTAGPYIKDFEKQIAEFTGADGAVACQSGTAGLHLALMEMGVTRDDIVIVPTLTFIATVNPVAYIGATPVFMDCDDTLCMDTEKLREYCESECELRGGQLFDKKLDKRVKCINAVHVFGNLADMESIMDIASEFNLAVVEDACESLGSRYLSGRYAGKHSGTIGDIGVFSFNGNKIITTGGGGAVVSRHSDKLEHIRFLSQQAKTDAFRFVHDEVGYNYRLTNIQAALGVAQMEQLCGFIKIKNDNYKLYKADGIELYPFRDDIECNRWFYSYLAPNAAKRDYLMSELEKRDIQTRPIWELMHRLKPYKNYPAFKIEKALGFHDRVVNLPCSTNLSKQDIARTASAIKEIMR